MSLTKAHNRMIAGSTINVLDFNATGDGSTNDTVAIQAAITNASSGDTIYFPSGNYVMGAVTVTKALHFIGNATITLSGSTAGFELKANMSNLSFKDLTIVGDANISNNHRTIWHDKTYTISNVLIDNLTITDCIQSIDIGGLTDVVIQNCSIADTAGTAAGQGYGIAAGSVERVRIINNHFSDNGRHAVYSRSGKDVIVTGNVFDDHSATAGGGLYAVLFVGVQNGIISDNVFRDTKGTYDISLDDDTDGTTVCDNVTISNNIFYGLISGDYGGIDTGASSVTGTEFVRNINIADNVFNVSPAKENGVIQVTNGRQIRIAGNTFQQTAGTATNFYAILLNAGAGDTHFDEVIIENNYGRFTKSSGNSIFVLVGSALCTGTTRIYVNNNDIVLNSQDYLISYAAAPTNENIETDWDYEKAVTLSSGSQTISGAGYNNFVITGDAGASTITNITDTNSGKEVTLRFVDSNTTLDRTNSFLSGGANFTSSNRDILKLLNRGGNWYETTRSVNS